MTSSNDLTSDQRAGSSRAELARQMLRLRALRHEAEEAERSEAAADPEAARAELATRLDSLVEQRRQALRSEMEAVRTEAAAIVAEARSAAAVSIERAEAELRTVQIAHGDTMTRRAQARESAQLEREAAARQEAAREAAARRAAEREAAEREAAEHAERVAALAALQLRLADEARTVPQPDPAIPTSFLGAAAAPPMCDDAMWARTVASNPGTAVPPRATEPPPPTMPPPPPPPPPPAAVPATPSVMLDAQAFAQAFGTVIAALIRDHNPRHYESPVPPPKPTYWSSAKHLDVMLIGVTMMIAFVVLAAWLV